MTLTLADDGTLTGTGGGQLTRIVGDTGMQTQVSATFTGGPTPARPRWASLSSNADPPDPFIHTDLLASEPLPRNTTLTLTSGSGDQFTLGRAPSGSGSPTSTCHGSCSASARPTSSRRAQVVDFAGNKALTSFQFTTRPAPPLAAEDGFESATGTQLGGAMVITGSTNPVIAGDKSLYIAPVDAFRRQRVDVPAHPSPGRRPRRHDDPLLVSHGRHLGRPDPAGGWARAMDWASSASP